MTVAPDALGLAGNVIGKVWRRYVNCVSLITVCTVEAILYSGAETPLILIGVPAFRPCASAVVTVTCVLAVVPLPEIIVAISIGSEAKAPTICHSGFLFAKSSVLAGNFAVVGIGRYELKAFDSLL